MSADTSALHDTDALYRALEVCELRLGAHHPDTLIFAYNLAALLMGQGKLAEAEPLFRRALKGREQQLGAQHPSTLKSVSNLATLLQAQGKLAEAEPLCRRALEGRERQLGVDHPSTLISVYNLTALLQEQGKLAEAETLFRRCASSREMASARCLGCLTQHNLKACAKCRVARFCSSECIARAWPAHKPSCTLWR